MVRNPTHDGFSLGTDPVDSVYLAVDAHNPYIHYLRSYVEHAGTRFRVPVINEQDLGGRVNLQGDILGETFKSQYQVSRLFMASLKIPKNRFMA